MLTNGGGVKESMHGNIESIVTNVGSAKALKSITGRMDSMSQTSLGTADLLPLVDATTRPTMTIKKPEQDSMT